MKVAILGCEFFARPHYVSWLARAYQRLGCDVVTVGGNGDQASNGYIDPVAVLPAVQFGQPRIGLHAVQQATGPVDLAVMVDCGNNFAVMNDGSAPYAYLWREANANEWGSKAGPAANGAPVFACMTGNGKYNGNDSNVHFMPFAVDREVFCHNRPYNEREFAFVYTGRERGNGTWGWVSQTLAGLKAGTSACTTYIDGYREYAELLSKAKCTYTVDSGRYVGSRGLEAMAMGCASYFDGGAAFNHMGFSFNHDCMQLQIQTDPGSGEYVPTPQALEDIAALVKDRERWESISSNARKSILSAHTYEHRAVTIAQACGITLPKTIEEV